MGNKALALEESKLALRCLKLSMLLIYLFVYSVSTATDCKVDWPTGAREIYPADAFIARPLLNLYNLHINIALGKNILIFVANILCTLHRLTPLVRLHMKLLLRQEI